MACAVVTPRPEPNGDFPVWLEAQGVNAEVARAMDSELGIRDYGVLRACVGDGLVRAELLATARDRLPFGFYAVLRQVVKALEGAQPHHETLRLDNNAVTVFSSPGNVTLEGLVEVLLALFSGLSREMLQSVRRLGAWDSPETCTGGSIPPETDGDPDRMKSEISIHDEHDKMEMASASATDDSMVQIKTEIPEAGGEALESTHRDLNRSDRAEWEETEARDYVAIPAKECPDEQPTEASSGFIMRLMMPMHVSNHVATSSSSYAMTTHGSPAVNHSSRPLPSITGAVTTIPATTAVTTLSSSGIHTDQCSARIKSNMQEQIAEPRASIITQQPDVSATGGELYFCSLCGQGFARSALLNVHLRKHTGDKLHLCAICGRGFSSNTNLNIHERTHTGEKPYRCSVCGQAFTQPNSLKRHQRMHTGEKPYRCEVCGQAFTNKPNMIYHQGKHLSKTMPQP